MYPPAIGSLLLKLEKDMDEGQESCPAFIHKIDIVTIRDLRDHLVQPLEIR